MIFFGKLALLLIAIGLTVFTLTIYHIYRRVRKKLANNQFRNLKRKQFFKLIKSKGDLRDQAPQGKYIKTEQVVEASNKTLSILYEAIKEQKEKLSEEVVIDEEGEIKKIQKQSKKIRISPSTWIIKQFKAKSYQKKKTKIHFFFTSLILGCVGLFWGIITLWQMPSFLYYFGILMVILLALPVVFVLSIPLWVRLVGNFLHKELYQRFYHHTDVFQYALEIVENDPDVLKATGGFRKKYNLKKKDSGNLFRMLLSFSKETNLLKEEEIPEDKFLELPFKHANNASFQIPIKGKKQNVKVKITLKRNEDGDWEKSKIEVKKWSMF